MSVFTPAQITQLLRPIAPQRVLQDGKGHSHVSQQDVTAHLIRMFGFGGFDTEVLSVECVFERERCNPKGEATGRFDVCYRALMRLTIRDEHGNRVCSYEDGSTATAQNQTLGDAHDLAFKSAVSLAKKRCAINLGDQFGLSLYNKGQQSALVLATLVGADDPPGDVEKDVPAQVALGNDETDYELAGGDQAVVDGFAEEIARCKTKADLDEVGARLAGSQVSGRERAGLREAWAARAAELAA